MAGFARARIKEWPPNEVLSLMALAQHHGIPTRLLDWSRHPLKAAWFAASEASESLEKEGLLSVWALSVELLDM
jgi:FRG domain-containing protein